MRVVTHNGSFHADDLFACATLKLIYPDAEIVRTRDPEIIASGDIVLDVGKVYDPEKKRFDHHQIGGAEDRPNGIPYAAFGLIWKEYGMQLCKDKDVFESIDKELVTPVDAWDNGIDLGLYDKKIAPATISLIFSYFTASWNEDIDKANNDGFLKMLEWGKDIIARTIFKTKATLDARAMVIDAYKKAPDKRLILLDKTYPAIDTLREFPEPLFIVRWLQDGHWGIKAIKKEETGFANRKDLPASWAGLDGEELQKVSGVKDAIFCHKNLFIAAAESKEGALEMARIALNS